jgi:hypothetical protein
MPKNERLPTHVPLLRSYILGDAVYTETSIFEKGELYV